MAAITRYILRQISVGTFLVALGMACILWLTQSLRFVELIVKKGLSIGTFLRLTLLLLPNFLVIIVPISLFAVVLFTYNRLNTDRELVVLRAAGMSDFGLARAALVLASVLAIGGYALTVSLVPRSVERFREMQWTIRNDMSAILLQEGMFTEISPNLTVYIRSRSPEGELLGILVHDKRSPNRSVTMMAERGVLAFGEQGPRVLMVNGNRQEVRTGENDLSLLYFDSYNVELSSIGDPEDIRFRDARERPMRELLTLSEADGVQPIDVRRFRVEAHQRIVNPLYNLTFVVIALATLLSGSFNRRGHGARILVAVGLMIAVEAAALGAGNLATKHLSSIPLLYVTALLPVVIGLIVLLRHDRRITLPWSRAAATVVPG
ncbi:MAG: LPS export ABC transporter permease LptF [Alphaproteobacteria bacterium]